MKQTEKLDLVLKYLYERKFDNQYYEVQEILRESGITVSSEEARMLAIRLKDKDFANGVGGIGVEYYLQITTYGIDYVESDSYSHSGMPIINNTYNLSGQNNSIVQHSNNVTINQKSSRDAAELMNSIRNILRQEQINDTKLAEIDECLTEIQIGINKEMKPKFAWKHLSTLTSEFASVGSFVLSLGQLIGAH